MCLNFIIDLIFELSQGILMYSLPIGLQVIPNILLRILICFSFLKFRFRQFNTTVWSHQTWFDFIILLVNVFTFLFLNIQSIFFYFGFVIAIFILFFFIFGFSDFLHWVAYFIVVQSRDYIFRAFVWFFEILQMYFILASLLLFSHVLPLVWLFDFAPLVVVNQRWWEGLFVEFILLLFAILCVLLQLFRVLQSFDLIVYNHLFVSCLFDFFFVYFSGHVAI